MKPFLKFCLVALGLNLMGCSVGSRSVGLEAPYVLHPAPAVPVSDHFLPRVGEVYVAVLIGPEGRPHDWLVTGASAPELVSAALAQLRQTVFAPGHFDGRPVPAHVGLVFDFTEDGPKLSATAVENLGDFPFQEGPEPTEPKGLVQLNQLDTKPRLIQVIPPEAGARPGRVKLQYLIDREGFVRLPLVIGADDGELGEAALAAVARWRFTPPLRQGRPVIALVRQEFRFGL